MQPMSRVAYSWGLILLFAKMLRIIDIYHHNQYSYSTLSGKKLKQDWKPKFRVNKVCVASCKTYLNSFVQLSVRLFPHPRHSTYHLLPPSCVSRSSRVDETRSHTIDNSNVKLSLGERLGNEAGGTRGTANDSFVLGFLKLTWLIAVEEEKLKCELTSGRYAVDFLS